MRNRRVAKTLAAAFTTALVFTNSLAWAEDEPGIEYMELDANENIVKLDLYNLTDVHGHIEQVKNSKGEITEAGLAAVSCELDKRKAENANSQFTLLGDNIGASPYTSGALQDNPTIAALNLLKPLASTIGNHELDMGQEVFKQRVDGTAGFTKIEFPYLGANVEGLGEKYLGDYEIWTSPAGVKVAYIGGIAQDVPYKLSPDTTKGMIFNDPIKTINDLAKQLKDGGKADVVIAMLDDDVKNNYPKMGKYVDGIMGGDTHVPYYFDMVQGAEGNRLSATASGSYTDNLSQMRIYWDKDAKKVVASRVIQILAAEVAKCGEDPAVKAVVDKAVEDSKAAGAEVVATGVKQGFYRAIVGDSGSGSNRGHESSLGDLVADALKGSVRTLSGGLVDIGIINAGDLRADLVPNEKGEITYAQTYQVEPFSNETGYVAITGADFKRALEQQWKTNLDTQHSRPMLKLSVSSNVTYTYDPAEPYGERITSLLIDGKPIDLAKTYTVGSHSFLLAGGDSFHALTAGGPAITFGNLDRDTFNEYLGKNTGLTPRALKSSVGVTLNKETVKPGESVGVTMRGLSFTEGPSITKKVKVSLGNLSVATDVDNNLNDPEASNEKAVITTDGAGQARANIDVPANFCEGKDGDQVLPLSIDTDFGQVVSKAHALKVTVSCPTLSDNTDGNDGKDKGDKKDEAQGKKQNTEKKSGKLASTGSDLSYLLAILAVSLGAMGFSVVTMCRRSTC